MNLFEPPPIPIEPTLRAAKAVRFGRYVLGTADLGQRPEQLEGCTAAALTNLAYLRAQLKGQHTLSAKGFDLLCYTDKADLEFEAREFLTW